MNEAQIRQEIGETFPGVEVVVAAAENGAHEISWGDTFFFHDQERNGAAQARFPFATIVTRDYAGFDIASQLDRPGVFRLNIGLGRETYRALFGDEPETCEVDFAALDRLMSHPVYGKMHWVCVLNPSASTFEKLRPLLAEAYELAQKRNARKTQPGGRNIDAE